MFPVFPSDNHNILYMIHWN